MASFCQQGECGLLSRAHSMDHLEAMRFNWRTVLAFFVGLSCCALPALAQKDINSGDGAVISYTPAFAQRFALPETAPALDPPDRSVAGTQARPPHWCSRGDQDLRN